MYTQLNQYHVILETLPEFQQDPSKLSSLYIQANASSGAIRRRSLHLGSPAAGSASAGSNATTASAAYTPSSGVLTAAGERAGP